MGDQRNMALQSRNDRSRDVFVDGRGSGGSNVYVSLHSRANNPSYRGRDSNNPDWGMWRGGRGRSRLPEGHWRGGSSSSNNNNNNNNNNRGSSYYQSSSRGGGGGPRRPPPPRYDDLLEEPRTLTDVTRTIQRQEMWRGARGRGIRRGGRPDGGRSHHQQQCAANGWQKIIVLDSAQHDPSKVAEELQSMVGETFSHHLLASEGNNITFYLEDNTQLTRSLLELSKRFAMPGNNQRLSITVTAVAPPFPPPTAATLEKVKAVMAERYSGHLRRLDLSEFHKDKSFLSTELLFPMYVQSNLASVGRLIVNNIPDVTEVDLSRNKLHGVESVAAQLYKCTHLTRLNLMNNKIMSLTRLQKLRNLPITDLSLEGNPVCNKYRNVDTYISDIRDYFPKLLVLDGKELPRPIGFEVDESDATMPAVRSSYFCNEQAKALVTQFLLQYYQVLDSDDRSVLRAAYCDDAIFSVSLLLPENGPRSDSHEKLPNRNLKSVQDTERRVELLHRGKDEIMKIITGGLPLQLEHDLDSFIVDLPIAKPALLQCVVSGVYRRRDAKTAACRSFQRSLIIVPEGEGYCIANEQLYVTLATYDQIKESFKKPSVAAAVPSAAAAAGGLEPLQLQLIDKFCQESGMLPQFSQQCLEQNAWDYTKSGQLFLQLKTDGKIPPEYFKQ